MMTSDYPDPSFSGDFLPVERVCRARYMSTSRARYTILRKAYNINC